MEDKNVEKKSDKKAQQESIDDKSSGLSGKKGKFLIDVIVTIVVAVLAVFLLKAFVVGTYEIPSSSMMQTIQIGDRVLSERISYKFDSPKVGDIVTFSDPDDPSRTLIKRVIATSGQTVDLKDGRVVIDGTPLEEAYTIGVSLPLQTASGTSIEYPITIPDGYIWVMGDNRENSADSRYFGPVKVSSVSGHAFFRYWPPSGFGGLS